MYTFPQLTPNARVFVPGDTPRSELQSLSGLRSSFRRGNRRIAQSLSLSYNYLTEADMLLIKNHYYDSYGTYEIFFLPAEVWADHASPPVPLVSDFAWRYATAPSITDVSFDRFSIEIELQTEPIDTGDLVIDGGLASATPARDYIVNGGLAAAAPARDYVISSGGAA